MLVYDVKNDSWSTSPAKPAVPRSDGCAVAVLGKVFYAGGYSAGYNATLDTVEVFDPATNTFSEVTALPTPRGDVMCASLQGMPTARHVGTGMWEPASCECVECTFIPPSSSCAMLIIMMMPLVVDVCMQTWT